jgi:hypothetical protein
VNVPGEIFKLVAPVAAQLSVLLPPELMLAGLATKDVIAGAVPFPGEVPDEPTEPQPARPRQIHRLRTKAQRSSPERWNPRHLSLFPQNELGNSMRSPSAAAGHTSLAGSHLGSYWPQVQKETAVP